MPPVTKPGHDQYDIVFIGGGSGGVAGSVSVRSCIPIAPYGRARKTLSRGLLAMSV